MPFFWNPKVARYQDVVTKQFVARSTVLQLAQESIITAQTAPPVAEGGGAFSGF